MSAHPLYRTWYMMLYRCENPRSKSYPCYGERGISVWERWHDVRLFIEDVDRLLGPRPPGRTLDRIDNEGNYEPGNVRWATKSEQHLNSRLYLSPDPVRTAAHGQPGSEEHWLPVPGYQGWYEVSDQGNVYSLSRPTSKGGLMRPQVSPVGYRVLGLSKYGRVRAFTVGHLVLEAFRGPANGRRARHGPGGKLDDSLANLSWC